MVVVVRLTAAEVSAIVRRALFLDGVIREDYLCDDWQFQSLELEFTEEPSCRKPSTV